MSNRYRCDRPMAEKMGMLPECDNKCETCSCAIKASAYGVDSHVNPRVDHKIKARNIRVLSGERIKRADEWGKPRLKGGGV